MTQATKDFTAGVCSGVTQVMIMQPFEIIKVRLQTQRILDCLKKTVQKEGVLSLYKGTLSPLIGCGFQVSIQFGFNEMCKRFFNKYKKNANEWLSIPMVAASGFIAGIGSAIVATPIQHARIRIQIQKDEVSKVYNGSVDAAKRIISHHGFKGLMAGFVPTLIRQTIGSCLYFTGYEWMMRKFLKPGQSFKDAPLTASLISGGFAGLCYWAVVYPMDFIKTNIQTDNLANRRFSGIMDVARATMRQGGIKSFYKGYLVCLLRAIPTNSGGFLAFEAAMRVLGREEHNQ